MKNKKSIIGLILLTICLNTCFTVYAQKPDDIKKFIRTFSRPQIKVIHIYIAKIKENGTFYYAYSYLTVNTSSGEGGETLSEKMKSDTKQALIDTLTQFAKGIPNFTQINTASTHGYFYGVPSTATITPLTKEELKELNDLLKKVRKTKKKKKADNKKDVLNPPSSGK